MQFTSLREQFLLIFVPFNFFNMKKKSTFFFSSEMKVLCTFWINRKILKIAATLLVKINETWKKNFQNEIIIYTYHSSFVLFIHNSNSLKNIL